MAVAHLDQLVAASNSPSEKVSLTVISVLSNPNLIRFATDALDKQRKQFSHNIETKHVVVDLKDTVNSDLLSVLPRALAEIDEALRDANPIPSQGKERTTNIMQRVCLVHCAKGASRSVSVVIAYLISRYPDSYKTFDEALAHVRAVRPQAMPNLGFVLALKQFARDQRAKRKL